jgi:hypothetical protein
LSGARTCTGTPAAAATRAAFKPPISTPQSPLTHTRSPRSRARRCLVGEQPAHGVGQDAERDVYWRSPNASHGCPRRGCGVGQPNAHRAIGVAHSQAVHAHQATKSVHVGVTSRDSRQRDRPPIGRSGRARLLRATSRPPPELVGHGGRIGGLPASREGSQPVDRPGRHLALAERRRAWNCWFADWAADARACAITSA